MEKRASNWAETPALGGGASQKGFPDAFSAVYFTARTAASLDTVEGLVANNSVTIFSTSSPVKGSIVSFDFLASATNSGSLSASANALRRIWILSFGVPGIVT